MKPFVGISHMRSCISSILSIQIIVYDKNLKVTNTTLIKSRGDEKESDIGDKMQFYLTTVDGSA